MSSRVYTAAVPKMPLGLVELMEGLAKDVLKYNPTDIYAFCANHMKKLIEIRDEPNSKHQMTLEQKIEKANKIIRERAARRREDYDNNSLFHDQTSLGRESDELNNIDKIYLDPERYSKDKIVKIQEIELSGDVEHEIIANLNANSTKPMNLSIAVDDLPELCRTKNDVIDSSEYSANNKNDKEVEHFLNEDGPKINKEKDFNDSPKLPKLDNDNDQEKSFMMLIENNDHTESEEVSNCLDNKEIVEKPDTVLKNHEILKDTENINSVNITGDGQGLNDLVAHKIAMDFTETKISNVDKITSSSHTEEGEQETNSTKANSNSQIDLHVDETDNGNVFVIASQIHENDKDSSKTEPQNQHVDNTAMDLEKAAITIQKVFRSFLFKNKTLSTEEPTNVDVNLLIEDKKEEDSDMSPLTITKDRRTLGLSRIDTVLQTVNEEKSLSQSTDDSSTLSSAATIIQAQVRGFLVRNKINANKNSSTTSGIDSDGLSYTSIEGDIDSRKNKTILNIHIVPESDPFMSRDESVLTSMDLSLDGSPPGSTNLRPVSYDRNERRKQLKREDAIQSISPPSNNSGKLSEDMDSVKEVLISESFKNENGQKDETDNSLKEERGTISSPEHEFHKFKHSTIGVDLDDTALEVKSLSPNESPVKYLPERPHSMPEMTSDEMDVVTPFTPMEEKVSDTKNDKLIHSGEFHEVVLPTKVSRSDTSIVRGE